MRKIADILLRAVLTGFAIAIGGTVYLSCGNKFLSAFLFGTGLFVILSFGFNLFTGKVGYAVEREAAYLGELGLIWLGNLAGAVLAALLFSRDKRRFIWKCAGSLCLFAALFILALKLGWWGDVFAVFNAQYAAEYGGMNMGDAAGIFLLWTPTAFAALIGGVIVSAGVRRSVIEKENLRASAGGLREGTDDTGT